MREVYPVVISEEKDGYFVYVPDFDINTQGSDLGDAIYMARDVIGLTGITLIDEGHKLPKPNTKEFTKNDNDIVTLVDVDFTEYRKKHDNRAVKKNCTLPYWLSNAAEKEGINFSRILQDALKKELGLKEN